MKHYLIRTQDTTGHATVYLSPCGYQSENPKEFTSITSPSIKGITCEACSQKLNKMTTVMMKGTV